MPDHRYEKAGTNSFKTVFVLFFFNFFFYLTSKTRLNIGNVLNVLNCVLFEVHVTPVYDESHLGFAFIVSDCR